MVETMADRIRELLKSKRLTYEALGAIGGVTPQAVQKWLSGGDIKQSTLVKLAQHFDTTPGWLKYGERAPERNFAAKQGVQEYSTTGLTPEGTEIALAWERLSLSKKRIYRECILRDAALLTVMPWLNNMAEPHTKSYQAIIESIQADYERHIKQLNLDL